MNQRTRRRIDEDVSDSTGGARPRQRRFLFFVLDHPLSTYYLIMVSTMLLLVIGLVMVLSASSIESYRVFGSPYTLAQRQALFAVLGVVLMFLMARTSPHFWRGIAFATLIVALVLLVVVLFIGVEVAGQRNWIEVWGPFRFQPSEVAKFALVIFGARVLAKHNDGYLTLREMLVPIVPVGVVMMVLVLLEGDFGNAMLLGAIMVGLLFAAGAPLRIFPVMLLISGIGIWGLTVLAPYRMARIMAWLNPGEDRLGFGWQVTQGQYALGTGGLLGVGLGASREKWGSLPEAHTDFIFPVIGEELGLIGTLAVLFVIGLLALAIFRLAIASRDPFVRIAAAGVGAWIVVQAVVNIGASLALLPITGLPLPLVSYGGSSLVPTLIAIGMLMSFARHEPGARTALRKRAAAVASTRLG